MGWMVPIKGRGRCGVRATPDVDLLAPKLLRGVSLVLSLECSVVALVQPPRATDGDPEPVAHRQCQLGGLDRSLLQRGVDDIGQDLVLEQHLACRDGLAATSVREIHIHPAGEPVLVVPRALTVPQQDERRHHLSVLTRAVRDGLAYRSAVTSRFEGDTVVDGTGTARSGPVPSTTVSPSNREVTAER